jgi:hypothetical protein
VGANIAVSLFGLLFGLAVLLLLPWQVVGESYDAVANVQSPAFFPILLSAMLVVFSAILAFSTARSGGQQDAAEDPLHLTDDARPIESPIKVAGVALCLILYYFALSLIGMIAASMILILVMSYIMGFRNFWIVGIVAVVIPLGIYFLFEKTLYVLLPAGKLF